ncbi:hypothetical protein P280DRAFT_465357 [Massarina eburnea CBS 473.64]|uniref:Uncharacterized protein n=1 Tax=Massarina eburnea CBS 473.64 TaxID=1395130 RepID=A0A6A6SDC0_9PLEO|nr:hypothetical protein P280DRAFT_465357 [Massarina eburnea CBS 473.64]
MRDASAWVPTLNCLRGQKRQTRNEHALSTNPRPRSKKKKILQNKWRTGKTIQTCENEETVILECLQVCRNNISTLEAIVTPESCPSSTGYQSATDGTSTNSYDLDYSVFDWKGWGDESRTSPFEGCRRQSLQTDEIAPEVPLDAGSWLACTATAAMSPRAAVFEPGAMHVLQVDNERPQELDKLSISGLLSSKRMQLISSRRFSDDAIGHLFLRLACSERPGLVRKLENRRWNSSSAPEVRQAQEAAAMALRKGRSV